MRRELTPRAQQTLEASYHKKIRELNEYIKNATKEENKEWGRKERHYYIVKLQRVRKGYTIE